MHREVERDREREEIEMQRDRDRKRRREEGGEEAENQAGGIQIQGQEVRKWREIGLKGRRNHTYPGGRQTPTCQHSLDRYTDRSVCR